jgi:hypothetical protein
MDAMELLTSASAAAILASILVQLVVCCDVVTPTALSYFFFFFREKTCALCFCSKNRQWKTAFQTSAPFSDFGLWGLILLPAIRFQS